jgi:TonB family protein
MNYLRLSLSVVASILSLTPALSQTPASVPTAPNDGQVMQWMQGEHIPPIANLPFTAKVELETVNQVADGTFITHKTFNIDARDSVGRTRVEGRRWMNQETGAEPQLLRFVIYDPATRTRTVVFPIVRTVRRSIQLAALPAGPETAALQKPVTSREDLGTDNMQDIPVRGERVIQTYPPGAFGNNRSVTIVTENWYSEALKINLLTKRTDPRFGVQTVRVADLVKGEPEPSLFTAPEDYKVITEALAQDQNASDSFEIPSSQSLSMPGVARAGVNGVGIPTCVYCPIPGYTDKARDAKLNGSVVLQAVVTVDGRAENISVVKVKGHELGLGLEENAIRAVAQWRFKPALGPDGKPVAVMVPVEVTFRIK